MAATTPERAIVLEWMPKRRAFRYVHGLDVPMPHSEAEERSAALNVAGHFMPVPLSRVLEKHPLEH